MPLGRLGGLLILGSCAFFVLTIIVASTGGSISIGGEGLGALLATSGFGVFAAGALLLGLTGSGALRSRGARSGLVVASGAMLAVLATSRVSVSSMLVLVFLIGLAAFGVGCVIAVLGLLQSAGPQRSAALTILVGVLLGSVAAFLPNITRPVAGQEPSPLAILAAVLGTTAASIIVAGAVRIALLGIDLRPQPDRVAT